MPTSPGSDVLGVIWIPSLFQTHFYAEVQFLSGARSAKSRLLEPVGARHVGLPGGLIFQAPGFPSCLLIGEEALGALDAFHGGTVKEIAALDPFGRPCVDALGFLPELFTKGIRFAPPVFDCGEPRVALETRRLSMAGLHET